MAQSTAKRHEHEASPEASPVSNDNVLIVAVEDGEGHGYFVPVDLTAFRLAIAALSPAWQNVAISGAKYELTRGGQSVAKKARKDKADVMAALTTWGATAVASLDPNIERFETRASMRVAVAREVTGEKIKAKLGREASEDEVTVTLPTAYAKYAAEIDSRLTAKIAAGYTPTARKSGGPKGEAASAVEI